MSCSNLVGGILDLCNDGFSGIEKVYIGNGPVESFVSAAGVISSITVGGVAMVPADFYTFEVPRQTSQIVETYNVSQENGTLNFQQDLSMVFNHLSADKRDKMLLLAQATSLVVVAKDNNGVLWSVGIENGAYMTAGTSDTGLAYGDRAGYTVTLSGVERAPMYEVDSAIVEA